MDVFLVHELNKHSLAQSLKSIAKDTKYDILIVMITCQPKFFSVIFIGRQNPQILNHDFLLKNSIIPFEKSPFKDIVSKQSEGNPFNDFLSTPVLTKLTYKNVNIIVEESRYQITDIANTSPLESPIVEFTKKYFSVLKYTPFVIGGFNFNYQISFGSKDEKIDFENKFISDRSGIYKELGLSNFEVSFQVHCPVNQNKIEFVVSKIGGNDLAKTVNFNYEFRYNDIDSFLANLDEVPALFERFKNMLTKLKIQC